MGLVRAIGRTTDRHLGRRSNWHLLLAGGIAFVLLALVLEAVPVSGGSMAPAVPHAVAGGLASTLLSEATASLAQGRGPAGGHPLYCPATWEESSSACAPSGILRPAASGGGWSELGTTPGSSGWLAYDAADGYAVFVGPTAYPFGSTMTTWTYQAGQWTQQSAVGPGYCDNGAAAYDSSDRQVVFVGGTNCTSAGQTWVYAAGLWTLTGAGAPPTAYATLADDPADGYLLEFGGQNYTCGSCNWTWAYLNGSWTNISSTAGPAPTARYDAPAAYDPTDGAVVLFGGWGFRPPYGPLNDTWEFAGGRWTGLGNGAGPSPRSFAALAPAPTGGGILLFGGQNGYNSSALLNDTWRFVNGSWSPLSMGGPVGGRWGGVLLPGAVPTELLVGAPGYSGYVAPYPGDPAETWTSTGVVWTNSTVPPPPVMEGAPPTLTYDAADGYVLLYGLVEHDVSGIQQFSAVTWSYAGGLWSNLSPSVQPSPRWGAGMVYDARDGYVVLFGGNGWLYDTETCGSKTVTKNLCGDTWEFVRGQWRQITPARAGPSNRTVGAGLIDDGADAYVLLAGGTCYGAGSSTVPCNDTWTFTAGNWTNLTATAGASPGGYGVSGSAYDATDGYVLVTFATAQSFPNVFTWSYFNGHWTNRTGSAGPAPWGALAFDPSNGFVLLFEATGFGLAPGGVDLTWAYVNGTWNNLSAQPFPLVQGGTLVYDAADQYVLLFATGPSSFPPTLPSPNGLNLYFAWGNISTARPVVRSFSATPAVTDVGVAVTMTVVAAGGVAPLGYSYSGLPPGCASANSSSLGCTPAVTGSFTVTVQVTDSSGNRSSASLQLVVNADPRITGITAAPANLTIGQRTLLTVNATGGTLPWTYAFVGLPDGCQTQSVPILPCIPSSAGSFTVNVTLSDAFGMTDTGSVALTVRPAGGGGAPSISSFSAAPPALVLGNATNLSVVAAGAGPLAYGFSGLPAGCLSSNASVLSCRPSSAGTYAVTAVVTDTAHASTSVTTNLTVYPLGGGAGLLVSAFAASPSTIPLGSSTVVEVIAAGGTGPIGFAYAGLPPGCLSENLSALPCQPTAVGEYSIQVTVSDSGGHRTATRTSIEVIPASLGVAPQVSALVASPATVVVGDSLVLFAAVAGGVPPLSFGYDGLPGGCGPVNASVLHCQPTEVGNFTVTVHVTDPSGRSASASTVVNVLPRPTGPTPGATPSTPFFDSAGGLLVLIAAGAAVASALALVLERRRRRRWGESLVAEVAASRTEEEIPPPEE